MKNIIELLAIQTAHSTKLKQKSKQNLEAQSV